MPWNVLAGVFFILFVAAFIKAVLGFGESLLAMPLLTLLVGIKTATPLVGLVAAGLTLLLLYKGWHKIDFRAAWRVMLSAVLGIPLGVWGLKVLPPHWIALGLGVVLIGVGLYNLLRRNLSIGANPVWAHLFGFAGGVLGGAYNTGGPPIVMYGTLRRWPEGQFQATLQGCFLPLSLLTLASQGVAGLWSDWVLFLFVLSIPLVLLAFWIGNRVSKALAGRHFDRLVYVTLAALGIMLVIQNL
jgi:uncharacterized membrane protein YfcA